MQTLLAAVTSGLALTGVLAVGGMGAAVLGRNVPALGPTALGAGMAAAAARLGGVTWPAAMVLVLLAGVIVGLMGRGVEVRASSLDARAWPPTLLPDIAVVAGGIALSGLLRPASALELPVGPLGGLPTTPGALLACAIGITAAAALAQERVRSRPSVGWGLAVAGVAVAASVGAGSLVVAGQAALPAFGVPDVFGLAIRGAAVGVAARRGLPWALGAALVLGVGESLIRVMLSLGETALLPAVVVLAWGLWRATRAPAAVPAT